MASIQKNVVTATVSNVFNNFCFFVFAFFLAKKYSVLDLSYYSLSFNIYFLATLLATLGISNLIIREYHKSQQKIKFISTLLRIELFAAAAIYFATMIVASFAGYETVVIHYLLVLCLMILFDSVSYVFTNVFISLREQHFSAIGSMIEAGLKLVFGFYVLFVGNISLLWVAAVLVVLRAISSVVHVTFFIRYHQGIEAKQIFSEFDHGLVRSIISDGKTFFLISVLVVAYNRLPIVMLSKLSAIENVTYMDMGFKAFNVMGFIPIVLVNTFYPTILTHIKKMEQLSEKTSKFLQVYVSVANAIVVISILLVPVAFSIMFGHKFDPSIAVFQILVLSLSITGITSTQANILFAHGMEKTDLIMNSVMFVVVIGLVLLLVPYLHALGAALSLFISRVGFLLSQRMVLRRRFPDLVLEYSRADAILVPLLLAAVVLLNLDYFGFPLMGLVGIGYLIYHVIRYRLLLVEILQKFLFRKGVQTL